MDVKYSSLPHQYIGFVFDPKLFLFFAIGVSTPVPENSYVISRFEKSPL